MSAKSFWQITPSMPRYVHELARNAGYDSCGITTDQLKTNWIRRNLLLVSADRHEIRLGDALGLTQLTKQEQGRMIGV